MLIHIDDLFTADEVRALQCRLEAAPWEDGARTAAGGARGVKHNQQLPDDAAPDLSAQVAQRLMAHPTFVAAALPKRMHPPRFNRYAGGGTYGAHVDAALMRLPGGGGVLRSDVSATVFLSAPGHYEGGELEIEDGYGVQGVKLEAGCAVVYPSHSLHRVTPVTRGERVAAITWVESLVPDAGRRALLFDLDRAIQGLTPAVGAGDARLLSLTHVYHNLVRQWAAT